MKYTIKEEDVPGVQNGEADIALTSYANGSYKVGILTFNTLISLLILTS